MVGDLFFRAERFEEIREQVAPQLMENAPKRPLPFFSLNSNCRIGLRKIVTYPPSGL
jgi:hypothetical protein